MHRQYLSDIRASIVQIADRSVSSMRMEDIMDIRQPFHQSDQDSRVSVEAGFKVLMLGYSLLCTA